MDDGTPVIVPSLARVAVAIAQDRPVRSTERVHGLGMQATQQDRHAAPVVDLERVGVAGQAPVHDELRPKQLARDIGAWSVEQAQERMIGERQRAQVVAAERDRRFAAGEPGT